MSEFGTGYAYCLGLFLAHEQSYWLSKKNEPPEAHSLSQSMWFYAASDHLFELEIPPFFSEEKRKEIQEFRDKCIEFRYADCSWDDVAWAVKKAKYLLREIDTHLKIKSEVGDYE